MKFFFSLLSILISLIASGQNIRWASSIVDVSSESSASEILGAPNAMNVGADRSRAWRPSNQSEDLFIVVAFDKPAPINQILIAEAERPGRITKIIGYNKDQKGETLLQLKPVNSSDASGYFHQFIPETSFDVYALRVEFDATNVGGPIAIDAIGVANQALPITLGIVKNETSGFGDYHINRLENHVNSKYVEHNPIVSLDGKTLYFSRQKHPRNVGGVDDWEDIWYCTWNDTLNEWGEAQNLGEPLNTSGPNFISSISLIEGKEVLLLGNVYESKGRMSAGVSMTIKSDEGFSKPVQLLIEDDYNTSDRVDYFLTENGKALLISSEREDSYGRRDLYVSFPLPDSEAWSAPMNLGDLVNSENEEESPFMAHDEKTLYFSSNRKGGNGGMDIYRTTRLDSTWTKWSEPENLGSKINGEGDEEYLSISSKGEHLYYTRSEPNGDHDIYDVNLIVKMVDLSGVVIREDTQDSLADVDIFFSNSKGDYHYFRSNKNGQFKRSLPANSRWVVSTSKNEFEAVSFEIIDLGGNDLSLSVPLKMIPLPTTGEVPNPLVLTPEVQQAVSNEDDRLAIVPSITLTEQLDAMNEGDSLQLHHVYFDLNSSYLRQESMPELMEFATFLIEHVDLSIELSAHTDSRQTQKYNQWMSDRRANRVRDFLIEYGVESDRITAAGYGETRLVNDCVDGQDCSEEEHQANRRTEIKILKKD